MIVAASRPALFFPYFGAIPAPFAVGVTVLAAGAALPFLAQCNFPARRDQGVRGLGVALLLAGLFAALVIAADMTLHFPRDINAPPPWSLLFYPVMGLVAESVFHIAPLTIFFLLTPAVQRERLSRAALLAAALPEPIFQTLAADGPAALSMFTALHVFGFSLCQLWLFRRHGFLTMYAMRFAYYLVWHIAWGTVRLGVSP
jgi:hypothetical protein